MAQIRPRLKSETVRRDGFRQFKEGIYEIGVADTLADANLERGDAYPEDSNYTIVQSQRTYSRGGVSFVRVVALKYETET